MNELTTFIRDFPITFIVVLVCVTGSITNIIYAARGIKV